MYCRFFMAKNYVKKGALVTSFMAWAVYHAIFASTLVNATLT